MWQPFQASKMLQELDELIEAAEFGITALTEIVQVQSVVQADILGDITSYYAGGKQAADKPTSVNIGGLVGSDEATGYLSQSVGTVVPIRYDIALDAGTAPRRQGGSRDKHYRS